MQPPSILSALIILRALSLSIWNSLFVSVCEGQTTTESPVCIPTGSRFSILQTVIAVSFLSLMTSYSISLKPFTLLSIRTSPAGDASRAFFIIGMNSSSFSANPPPVPPRVKAGRRTTGKPILRAISRPFSCESAISDGSTGSPSPSQSSLNFSLSSAFSIESTPVPSNSALHSLSMPFFSSCIARLSPVCPPIFGKMASGLSNLTIFAMYSSVSGSIYTLSAIDVSVIIVAGFELQSTTS